MIILHQHQRLLAVLHFLQQGVGEFFVHVAIVAPVFGPKQRPGMGDMAEGPQAFIGEAIVVAFFLFRRQPDAAQRVPRLLGRYRQPVLPVHGDAVRIAGPMRDPRAVGGAENRLHRGNQSAGRHDRLDGVAPPDMHVWFPV